MNKLKPTVFEYWFSGVWIWILAANMQGDEIGSSSASSGGKRSAAEISTDTSGRSTVRDMQRVQEFLEACNRGEQWASPFRFNALTCVQVQPGPGERKVKVLRKERSCDGLCEEVIAGVFVCSQGHLMGKACCTVHKL